MKEYYLKDDVKKVLFVDHAPGIGGAEVNLLNMMAGLPQKGWQSYLACVEGTLASEARQLGIPCYIIPLPQLRRSWRFFLDWVKGIYALVQLCQQVEADIIYANTVRASLFVAPAAKLAKRPFIWHMQDFWLSEAKPNQIWLDSLGKKILSGFARTVIVNSHRVAQNLPNNQKLVVMHYGIDATAFDPNMDGDLFREQYGIAKDAILVGMMGRLRPWKGQRRFLKMAQSLRDVFGRKIHFIIVGGSPFKVNDGYEEELLDLVKESHLEDQVTFTGHLQIVLPALAAMDIYVHPGEPEPFGLVNIEAMAMSKPVVALSHGALPEIVVPGRTGLLVLPGDGTNLAQAVASLVNDPSLNRRMGRAGRERVLSDFSLEKMMSEISKILDRSL